MMKKILNFAPVALALLTLASCSENDLFGNANADVDANQITLNVTEADGETYIDGTTRAYRAEDYTGMFVKNDIIRVYDNKLQAYSTFKHNGTTFVLDGTTDATEGGFAYGIFGGDEGRVSYAGWKNGENIALMKLPKNITYGEEAGKDKDGNDVVVYKSALPQWGEVKPSAESDRSFDTDLKRLTAFAKIIFKNGSDGAGITAVRARALKFNAAADKTAFNTAIANGTKKLGDPVSDDKFYGAGTNAAINDTKRLNGWFEAELKTGGVLRELTETGVIDNTGADNTITVNVASGKMASYTNVVYLPIISQDYELLTFEYQKGGNWYFLRAMVDLGASTLKTNGIGGMTQIFALNITDVESIKSLTDYLNYYKNEGEVSLNVSNGGTAIACENHKVAQYYTIQIPNLKSNMVVDINEPIDLSNHKLIIADRPDEEITNTAKTITINFKGGLNGASTITSETFDIQINSKQPVIIGGDFSTNKASYPIEVAGGDVTFSDLKLNQTGNKIVIPEDATATVTVDEATTAATDIFAIENNAGSAITINGGDVKTLQLVKNADQTITMNGGKISTAIAAPTADLTASFKVTVNSKGAAEIAKAVMKTTGTGTSAKNLTYEFNATIDENTTIATALGTLTKADATDVTGSIFTGAQLLKAKDITTPTTITLQADITAAANAYTAATPVLSATGLSLNASTTIFDGNKHAIKDLKQPLFGTLSAGVKDLSLTGVEIEATTNNVGALAKVFNVTADATVENVVVSGTKIGAEYSESGKAQLVFNVGGLFGQVTNAAAKKLTIDNCAVTLDAIQGYYNLGGFIGNAEDDNSNALSIDIVNNAAVKDMNKSNIKAFKKTFWANLLTDENCGKVGYFIGGITNQSAKVKVTLGKGGQDFSKFFSAAATTFNTAKAQSSEASQGRLEFDRNLGATGTDKAFVGMTAIPGVGTNQYIGYSTGTMDVITVWGGTTHSYGSGTSATIVYWKDIVNKRAE